MKDSKNKLKKSSSESKILETKTGPPMPKRKAGLLWLINTLHKITICTNVLPSLHAGQTK